MRIPKDIPLSKYIRQLISRDQIAKFYLSDDWKELREDVLEAFHYECQECLKKGRYTKADCVHHINEVIPHPELALSKYYVNAETGKTEPNLIPLCNTCHNKVHDKLGKWQKKDKFTNEEKW
jgi:5-methylcytosine-specific restriction endonuclease McrA